MEVGNVVSHVRFRSEKLLTKTALMIPQIEVNHLHVSISGLFEREHFSANFTTKGFLVVDCHDVHLKVSLFGERLFADVA